jgi:hypothetical protein
VLVEAGVDDYVERFKRIAAALMLPESVAPPSLPLSTTSYAPQLQEEESKTVGSSSAEEEEVEERARCSWNYLSHPAEYDHGGCLLDGARMPVMMPWEGDSAVRIFLHPCCHSSHDAS